MFGLFGSKKKVREYLVQYYSYEYKKEYEALQRECRHSPSDIPIIIESRLKDAKAI